MDKRPDYLHFHARPVWYATLAVLSTRINTTRRKALG